MTDAWRTLIAAETALERGDGDTADFLLVAARGFLGSVFSRMPGAPLRDERDALTEVSAAIADLRAIDPAAAREAMPALLDQFNEAFGLVHRARKDTLYEPTELKRWLEARE